MNSNSMLLKNRWWLAGAVLTATLTGVLLVSRPTSTPVAVPEVHRTTPWLEGGVIHYPPGFAEREHLAFAPAAESDLTPTLKLTGEIQWDPRRVSVVGARIEGRLRSMARVEGETVKAGDVLAELESVELGRAQAEVLKARAREQVARADAERERRLADAKVSAERDAQFALANAEALTAERVAAEKAVEALGGAVGGELGILRLRSPIAGHVVEVKALRGETVEPTDTVMVIADRSKVWAEFTIFERDVAAAREGDLVELRVAGQTEVVARGTVSHVSEALQSSTRAGSLRVELDNAQGLFRVGQSVNGTLHASGPRARMLSVPHAAVTRIDGVPTVFVKVGPQAVEPRPIKLGAEDERLVAVVDGLTAGDAVVTTGVLALKAEVFR